MLNNKMRGTWDQVKGIGQEFWGEITGDGHHFSAGLRQRKIGKLEVERDMSQAEAVKKVDQQKH